MHIPRFIQAPLLFWTILLNNYWTNVLTYPQPHRPNLANYDKIVVFGDSVSDDGVEADEALSHGFQRFSNGQVWPEYLSEVLESAHYQNYAYSGAKSGMDNYYFDGWSGVLWQIETYLRAHPVVPDDTLILLEMGGLNDLLDGGNHTDEVAENAKRAVTNLANQGATRIVLLNLADLSLSPYIRSLPEEQRAKFIQMVQDANSKTARILQNPTTGISKQFPQLRFRLFDLNSATVEALTHFGNTTTPYTHHSENNRPGDIYQFAWYDTFHPSTFVHKRIADRMVRFLEDWV